MKLKAGLVGMAMAGLLGVFGVGAALANGDAASQTGAVAQETASGWSLQQDGEDGRNCPERDGEEAPGGTPDEGATPAPEASPDAANQDL